MKTRFQKYQRSKDELIAELLSVDAGGLSRRYLDVWGVTDNRQPYFNSPLGFLHARRLQRRMN
jgi:hypothetical protein